ncbi:hypothetical protein NDU88_003959 [Pleurodeles waltl]|uniref:Uncharacterized protein n=1 Tax=Pleurodeles waltl TaxID=8319 RepID=A0AAV7T6S8_PLEWA|nr:hypothetical protein NDU88_003959 [Pleurodeles waltl]
MFVLKPSLGLRLQLATVALWSRGTSRCLTAYGYGFVRLCSLVAHGLQRPVVPPILLYCALRTVSTTASIVKKHQEGEVNETNATVGQQLVDEKKTPMDSKTFLKRKAFSSKKTYIHSYFIRARCGAGEGDEEGDSIIPLDNPAPQASQAPFTLLSPILEYATVPRLTRTEHKREHRQKQELDSTRRVTIFGMGSSIIEELVVLAHTALDECWNSPNGKNNVNTTTKTCLVGEPKEAICTQ